MIVQVKWEYNKKLSCPRDRARFVSLNILLIHSRSLKAIRSDTVEQGVCKSVLVCIETMYLIPFLRFSAPKNGVTLKPGLGVVQDH